MVYIVLRCVCTSLSCTQGKTKRAQLLPYFHFLSARLHQDEKSNMSLTRHLLQLRLPISSSIQSHSCAFSLATSFHQTVSSVSRKQSCLSTSPSLARKMAEFPPPALKKIAEEVAAILRQRQETIAVAETAAGGLISASLLASPGASKFYKGGLTVYTLPSRIEFAGWTQVDIDNYKGPTKEVVSGLAENVRAKLGSTYCVSESGTAGPTGGNTPNRTPGYVALAVAHEGGQTTSVELDTGYGTDRHANMLAFAMHALKLVKDVISNRGTKM